MLFAALANSGDESPKTAIAVVHFKAVIRVSRCITDQRLANQIEMNATRYYPSVIGDFTFKSVRQFAVLERSGGAPKLRCSKTSTSVGQAQTIVFVSWQALRPAQAHIQGTYHLIPAPQIAPQLTNSDACFAHGEP